MDQLELSGVNKPEIIREDQFISYWRSILLARAFNQIRPPEVLVSRFSIAPFVAEPPIFDVQTLRDSGQEWCTLLKESFLSGKGPKDLFEIVFTRLDADVERKNVAIRKKNARSNRYKQAEIDPLIANPVFRVEYAPCVLRRRTDNRRFIPMFGVATIDRNNIMRGFHPGEGSLPPPLWFRRLFMSPHDSDVPLTIGDQKNYITWVNQWLNKAGSRYDWVAILELFDGSWKAATGGKSILEWAESEGYAVESGFIREGVTNDILLAMHAAYGEFRTAYKSTPKIFQLFKNLIIGKPGKTWEGEASFFGFTGDTWGLTASQRSCLEAFTMTPKGQTLAVNGPPGTGKTTLLRTVMADMVVRSVIEGYSPPFIVACGATNQSVTNILEAFAGASGVSDLSIENRWIPLLSSYGSYAASSRLKLENKLWKHQILTLNPFTDFSFKEPPSNHDIEKSLTQLSVINGEYNTARVSDLVTALLFGKLSPKEYWLKSFKKSFNAEIKNNLEAADFIKLNLKNLVENIRKYDEALALYRLSITSGIEISEEIAYPAFSSAAISMLSNLSLVNKDIWINRWQTAFESHKEQGFGDALAAAADVSFRRLAFHLASRYWENKFLETLLREQGLPGWTREVEAFRTLSMIMPCMVATFDRLPNLLKRSERGHGRVPMWAEADLLIVDEAGQAGPDKGALAFAYAKKALVVGDVLQLAPVSDEDSPFFDQEIGEEHGILDNDAKQRGLLCGESLALTTEKNTNTVYGSIMRAASFCSAWSSSSKDLGMWLFDHFRCEPTIIDYCNRHWYSGRLITRTNRREREIGMPYLPPMGHIDVAGRNLRVGTSRTNPEEALYIVNWLVKNHDYLIETFGKKGDGLDDIVAIITPFASQDYLIKNLLYEKLGKRMGSRLKKMIHGTVHCMQGAERFVIIFSTVYSGEMFSNFKNSSYFFDREPRILNVAVSRAQKAFIVIGDRRIFDNAKSGSATSNLGQHLNFYNELPFTETNDERKAREQSILTSFIDPLRNASDWK